MRIARSSLFIQVAFTFLLIFSVATDSTSDSSSRTVGHKTDFPSSTYSKTPSSSPSKPSGPTQASADSSGEAPVEQLSQTPSDGPYRVPVDTALTRRPDASPTVSPTLFPSQAPYRVGFTVDERELSCYTYNITNRSSANATARLLPCDPGVDEYCITYAIPSYVGGGMVVGSCSPSNCLSLLRTDQHVIVCNACRETACNAMLSIPVSSNPTSSASKSWQSGCVTSAATLMLKSSIMAILLNQFLF
jgi:hypothetical protein